MHRITTSPELLLVLAALVAPGVAHAQDSPPPIPVEIFAGSRYASTNVVMSRNMEPGSRFGFYHLNTIVLNYDASNDLSLQNMLYYEVVEGYRLAGGLFYGSNAGLIPTVGAQFVKGGGRRFLLLTPRVNIQDDPSYSVFTIVRYGVGNPPGLGPYASLQALTTFDGEGHIKSYQWVRLGLESGGNQFGVAFNLDESGPDPDVEFSVGVFVRREVF